MGNTFGIRLQVAQSNTQQEKCRLMEYSLQITFEACLNFAIACRHGSHWLAVDTGYSEAARDLDVDLPHVLTTTVLGS